MNTLIGKLILFINTTIKHDLNYIIALFIIEHYSKIEHLSIKSLIDECFVSRTSILRFCELFGFHCWQDFYNELMKSRNIKRNQLESHYNLEFQSNYYNQFIQIYHDSSIRHTIEKISQIVKESHRIYLFGAIYPLSLSFEFQTNMISIGKKVYVDYRSLDDIKYDFNENDLAIIMSASGRYMRECTKKFHQIYFSSSKKVLITFLEPLETLDKIDYYIQLPSTQQIYDYNFQIMYFLELLFCECFIGRG